MADIGFYVRQGLITRTELNVNPQAAREKYFRLEAERLSREGRNVEDEIRLQEARLTSPEYLALRGRQKSAVAGSVQLEVARLRSIEAQQRSLRGEITPLQASFLSERAQEALAGRDVGREAQVRAAVQPSRVDQLSVREQVLGVERGVPSRQFVGEARVVERERILAQPTVRELGTGEVRTIPFRTVEGRTETLVFAEKQLPFISLSPGFAGRVASTRGLGVRRVREVSVLVTPEGLRTAPPTVRAEVLEKKLLFEPGRPRLEVPEAQRRAFPIPKTPEGVEEKGVFQKVKEFEAEKITPKLSELLLSEETKKSLRQAAPEGKLGDVFFDLEIGARELVTRPITGLAPEFIIGFLGGTVFRGGAFLVAKSPRLLKLVGSPFGQKVISGGEKALLGVFVGSEAVSIAVSPEPAKEAGKLPLRLAAFGGGIAGERKLFESALVRRTRFGDPLRKIFEEAEIQRITPETLELAKKEIASTKAAGELITPVEVPKLSASEIQSELRKSVQVVEKFRTRFKPAVREVSVEDLRKVGLSSQQARELLPILRKEKPVLKGSFGVRFQIGGLRDPRDIDLAVSDIVGFQKKIGKVGATPVFDIKPLENLVETRTAQIERLSFTPSGIGVQRPIEQLSRKVQGSILFATGVPDQFRRAKDVADVIALRLQILRQLERGPVLSPVEKAFVSTEKKQLQTLLKRKDIKKAVDSSLKRLKREEPKRGIVSEPPSGLTTGKPSLDFIGSISGRISERFIRSSLLPSSRALPKSKILPSKPSKLPSKQPSGLPSKIPSLEPSLPRSLASLPSSAPSRLPSRPSSLPSRLPSLPSSQLVPSPSSLPLLLERRFAFDRPKLPNLGSFFERKTGGRIRVRVSPKFTPSLIGITGAKAQRPLKGLLSGVAVRGAPRKILEPVLKAFRKQRLDLPF